MAITQNENGDSSGEMMKGSHILMNSLIAEGVDTIFGYPGGAIMPVYDALYDYADKVKHILSRHEQGAIHAAQGYARVSGKVGVCFATSGPGATNLMTGIADAMIDSTPLVCFSGQVVSSLLGSDAFQESDVVGMSMPVTKWNYQVKSVDELQEVIAKAFFIASTGRPGPVLIDLTKDVQIADFEFAYKKCIKIRSYLPEHPIEKSDVIEVGNLIKDAKRPMILVGQGVVISKAESELLKFIEKTDIPCASTLLGLSAVPTDHPLNKGMLGMHGNYGPNMLTNECDLLIAIGMRFDDRVTGDVKRYAKQAKVVHIEIDPSEIGKIITPAASICGDARKVLRLLNAIVPAGKHTEWNAKFDEYYKTEYNEVINNDIYPTSEKLKMGEVINKITEFTDNRAILVTDVGQQQMMAARYFKFTETKSVVTSGGLGTMGFGLPAAIGAAAAKTGRDVVLFAGDGGIQMNIQELGTLAAEELNVKIIILNNCFLGMVRQWQELFFEKRYSFTPMNNPDFVTIAKGYGLKGESVDSRDSLEGALERMFADDSGYVLEVKVECEENVFPMIAAGASVSEIMLKPKE